MEKLAICNERISQSKPDLQYMIEREYARAYIYICACTCIRMSLHLFTRKNTNAVSYVRMREFACMYLRVCLRAALTKTQNAFARKIFQHSKCTLGSETFRMYYIYIYIYIYFLFLC